MYCNFRSHVYPHIYNPTLITIPIVDYLFLLHPSFQVTFHKLLLILRFNYTKYKFYSSGYQAEFSPRPLLVFHSSVSARLERGLISSFTRILIFWIPQTVTWPTPSKSVTKFGRPKAMMPVPIVFLFIRSYLVYWPFYLSVFV